MSGIDWDASADIISCASAALARKPFKSISNLPINPKTWMYDIYQAAPDCKINEVVIPGTHDSATNEMTKRSSYARFNEYHRVSQKLVYNWAKCQQQSIHTQLIHGIRYIDLRVENHETGWRTFHGLVSNDFQDVVESIASFAVDNPREIVVVDFQHLVHFRTEDHIKLITYICRHVNLGKRLAGHGLTIQSTFQELWSADRNILLLYSQGNQAMPHLFHARSGSIHSPWHNTPKLPKLRQKLLESITDRDESSLYVSQFVVTPNIYTVLGGFVTGTSSLHTLSYPCISDVIQADFLKELDINARANGKHLNIVIVDFYDESSFVSKCLEINLENLKK